MPGALFQLVTGHPHFEWLRPLSRFMADLDERIDEPAQLVRIGLELGRARVDLRFDDGHGQRWGAKVPA